MIPYNPSSFDTNKTLLENILELKKWLQAHPCYEVFYSSANGDTSQQQTYNTSTITDPDNLAVGDVVVFANTTLGNVIAVDSDLGTFTCDPAVSFKGATGATGATGNGIASITLTSSVGLVDTYTILYTNGTSTTYTITNGANGTNGTNGVSITNVSINASYELVCTLSDGNTINAGAIWYIINTASSVSGTLSADNLSKLSQTNVVWHTSKLLSPAYHARLILTEGIGQTTKQFGAVIDVSGTQYLIQISVDSSTGIWSRTETSLGASAVEGTSVLSTGETSGKVLTADGSGGASWQTAGGGGSVEGVDILSTGISARYFLEATGSGTSQWTLLNSLYQHNISLYNDSIRFTISLQIINNDNSSLNTIDKIKNAMLYSHNTQDRRAIASGSYYDVNTSTLYNVCGMFRLNTNKLQAVVIDSTGNRTNIEISSATINDYIKKLE